MDFRVRRSKTGLGLYASRSFSKGEFIAEYTGPKIKTTQADMIRTKYLFDLENGWTVDGSVRSNIARFINHSCKPNAEAELKNERIFLYATRKIAAGEEMTFDYGEEYFDEFIKPFGCKCERCEAVLV